MCDVGWSRRRRYFLQPEWHRQGGDDVAHSLTHAAFDFFGHGAFARNRLRHEARAGHTLSGGSGARVVHEAFVDECNGWFLMLLDEDCAVQTVLRARPSIADGNDDRVHLLLEPLGEARPFIFASADVVCATLGEAANADLVAETRAQLAFDRILDWDRRALVVRVEADAFAAQIVEPRRNALEWDGIDLGPRAQDVVEGVHTPKG